MSELEQLTEFCRSLGAPAAQAGVMAAQLQKRCAQLAADRGISREAAMAHLLRVVTAGSQGQAPEGFAGGKPPE